MYIAVYLLLLLLWLLLRDSQYLVHLKSVFFLSMIRCELMHISTNQSKSLSNRLRINNFPVFEWFIVLYMHLGMCNYGKYGVKYFVMSIIVYTKTKDDLKMKLLDFIPANHYPMKKIPVSCITLTISQHILIVICRFTIPLHPAKVTMSIECESNSKKAANRFGVNLFSIPRNRHLIDPVFSHHMLLLYNSSHIQCQVSVFAIESFVIYWFCCCCCIPMNCACNLCCCFFSVSFFKNS